MLLRFLGKRAAEVRLERFSRAKRRAQIHLVVPKETGAQATIGRETNTIARTTIRVRHRRDDADRAPCAGKVIVCCRPVAAWRAAASLERTKHGRGLEHFVARYN